MSQEQTERQSQRELFWLDDPAHFFVRWHKFLPTNDMTVPEALNAVVRFTIYSAVLVAIVARRTDYLLLIPLVMLVSVILVRLFPLLASFLNFDRSVIAPCSFATFLPSTTTI